MAGEEDQVLEEVKVILDPASLKALESAFTKSFASIGNDLTKNLNKSLGKLGKDIAAALREVKIAPTIAADAKKAAKAVGEITSEVKQATKSAKDFKLDTAHSLEDAAKDAQALATRIAAVHKEGSGLLIDPKNLAVLDRMQEKLLALQRNIHKALSEGVSDPQLARSFNAQFDAINRSAVAESKNLQSQFRNANAELQRQQRERLSTQQAADRQALAETQNEGKLRAREARTAGELALAEEKNAGKARVQNLQTIGRLLVQTERGIGVAIAGVTRTSAAALGRVYQDTLGRIPNLFKRNQSEILSSERVFQDRLTSEVRSSTRSRTTVIERELNRQARATTAAQARISSGVTGALTGRGVGSGIFALGAGALGGAGLVAGLKAGFDEAVNVTEQLNKLQVLIGGPLAQANAKFANDAARIAGVTKGQFLEAQGNFAGLFKGIGQTNEQASLTSSIFVQLAADMASFSNTSPQDALEALRSGLVGEQEPLRRYSVFLSDAVLKQRAVTLGIFSGKGVLTTQQKTYAAIAEILAQTNKAQGDFARTSNEVANRQRIAAARTREFFAAIASFAKPIVRVGLGGVIEGLRNATNFITGNLSPAMKVLRDAAFGAAAGIAALLVAKAAAEALQLLGTAVQFALTPFGLLTIAFAAAGALFLVLNKRSQQFRDIVDDVRGRLGDLAQRLGEIVSGQFKRFADFMQQTGIPALQRFGEAAVEQIGKAVNVLVAFAQSTALPFLQNLTDTLFRLATRGFGAVKSVLEGLQPFFRSASNFFGDIAGSIGSGVGNLFRGKFADAFGDLQAVGSRILTAIGPILQKVSDFFVDTFNAAKERIKKINWADVGGSILDGIRFVGKQIGNLLTDPKTLGIVGATAGALAIAAAAIAGNFVVGLIQGIQSNIGPIGKIIKDNFFKIALLAVEGFRQGLVQAFRSPEAFALIFAGAALFAKIKRGFNVGGAEAARSFAAGLTSTKSDFFSALFGRNSDQIFNTRVDRFTTEANRKIGAINRVLKAGGQPLVDTILPGSSITTVKTRLGQAEKAFETFGKDAGASALKGFNIRASLASGLNFSKIADDLRLQGKSVGQAFAGGAVAAITSALSGAALGRGDVLGGLTGIAASSIAAGVALGPEVGIATAAIGGLSAIFTAHANAVKHAKAEVREYSDALADATSKADIMSGVLSTLNANLKDESTGTKQALLDLGFNAKSLADAVSKGDEATKDFLNNTIGKNLFAQLPAFKQFFEQAGLSVSDFGDQLRKGNLSALIEQAFGSKTGGQAVTQLSRDLQAQLKAAGIDVNDLSDAFDFLHDEVGEAFSGLNDAQLNQKLSGIGENIDVSGQAQKSIDAIKRLGQSGTEAGRQVAQAALDAVLQSAKDKADNARLAFDNANVSLQKLINPRTNTLATSLDQAIVGAESFATQLSDNITKNTPFAAAQVRLQFDQLSTQISDLLSQGIKDGTVIDPATASSALKPFEDAILSTIKDPFIAATVKSVFDTAFSGIAPVVDAKKAQDSANAAVTAVQGALNQTPVEIPVQVKLTQDILNKAHATSLASASALETSINLPVKVTPPSAAEVQAQGLAIGKDLTSGFANANPSGAITQTTQSAVASAGAVGAVQAVVGGVQTGSAYARGTASGIKSNSGQVAAAASGAVNSATAAASANAGSQGRSIGRDLAQGVEQGIRNNSQAAARAAAQMVTDAANAAREAAAIASPSKVFATIGQQISAGLAKGIADNADDVGGAIDTVIQGIVDKMSGSTNVIIGGAQRIRETLFDLLFNQEVKVKLALDTEQAKESLASGLFGFADSARQALAAKVGAAFKKGAGKEPLTTEDFQALQSNPFSLALTDRVGVQNRAAIVGQVASIKDLGKAIIDSGGSAQTAVAQMKGYRDQLIRAGVALGFNGTSLSNFVTQLGLGDAALTNFVKQVGSATTGLKSASEAAAKAAAEAAKAKRTAEVGDFTQKFQSGDFNLSSDTRVLGAGGAPSASGIAGNPLIGVVNLNLPTGDPEANALAVTNKLAMLGAV